MKKIRRPDGRVSFSHLKHMARSPAHYRCAVEQPREPTRAMRVGTVVHRLVLGERPGHLVKRFEGEARRGKEWLAFVEANPGAELVTAPEWAEAEDIAAAVMSDPVATALLQGTATEAALEWEDAGTECGTSGVDFIGRGLLGDLKITTNVEPEKWQRHALNMLWHAQVVWYRNGARANGRDVSRGLFLLGVENTPPFVVTALELSEPVIELAEKTIALWLEKLRVCEENDFWPGYVQSPVPMVLPAWMGGDDDHEAEESAA